MLSKYISHPQYQQAPGRCAAPNGEKLRETKIWDSGNWDSKRREAKGLPRVRVRGCQKTQVQGRSKEGCWMAVFQKREPWQIA